MRTSKRKTQKKQYCLDVFSGNKQNNTPLIAYPCHGGPNQTFVYRKKTRQIYSPFSKKCLENRHSRIVLQSCQKKKTQKWTRKGKKWLNKKQCLDVEGGHYVNGELIAYPCHNGPNQKFTLNRKTLYTIPPI